MDPIKQAVQNSMSGNFWARKTVCTAPKGKVRVVQIDPRDHTPTFHGDYDSEGLARDALGIMMSAQREVMRAYDDKGELVLL